MKEPFHRHFRLSEHVIRSQHVAQMYRIRVLQPTGVASGTRLPVLYATDGDELFDALATLSAAMQRSLETTPFILVGIGYENNELAELLRLRDLLTRDIRTVLAPVIDEVARELGPASSESLTPVRETTDARDFMSFIRSELIPMINCTYATQPEAAAYFGYSAGGTFGLYGLYCEPEVFSGYILGSPATSYRGHHYGIELAGRAATLVDASHSRLFLSVGELEESGKAREPYELVTGFHRLVQYLQERKRFASAPSFRVFPEQTHATAWALAFIHGVKMLFAPESSY